MLLNEFLKEHRKVEEQAASLTKQDGKIGSLEATVAQQQASSLKQEQEIESLTAHMKEAAAQVQKVSASLQFLGGMPRVVTNTP